MDPWLENPHDLHRGNTLVTDIRCILDTFIPPLPPPSFLPCISYSVHLVRCAHVLCIHDLLRTLTNPFLSSSPSLLFGFDQLALVLDPLRGDSSLDVSPSPSPCPPTVPLELLRSLALVPVPTTGTTSGPAGLGFGLGGHTLTHTSGDAPSFDFHLPGVTTTPGVHPISNPSPSANLGLGSGASPGPGAIISSSHGKQSLTTNYMPDLPSQPLTNAQMSTILWCVHSAHGLGLANGSIGGGAQGVGLLDGTAFSLPLPRTDKSLVQSQSQSQHQDKGQGSLTIPQLPLFDGSIGAEASHTYLTSFHRSLLLLGTPPVDTNTVIGQPYFQPSAQSLQDAIVAAMKLDVSAQVHIHIRCC